MTQGILLGRIEEFSPDSLSLVERVDIQLIEPGVVAVNKDMGLTHKRIARKSPQEGVSRSDLLSEDLWVIQMVQHVAHLCVRDHVPVGDSPDGFCKIFEGVDVCIAQQTQCDGNH